MKNSCSPIIGLSASMLTIDTGRLLGRERVFVGQDYVKAIVMAGGVPIILPIVESQEQALRQLELVDGLILSGGYDVDPHLFGEEPHHLLEATYLQRDLYEMALLQKAYQKNLPVLGICRGIQLINVAFGGSLYQDLSDYEQPILQHCQKNNLHQGTHTVEIAEETILKRVFKQNSIRTNSLHHQAIKELAKGFTVSARSRDGMIEAIEKNDYSFMVGLQWHPELMVDTDEPTLALFETFITACKERKSNGE